MGAELTVTEQRERQRLAVALHDELAQLLYLIGIKLSLAKQQPMQPPLAKIITEMEEVTNKAMTYTRTLMSQLSPPALSESGLPMALQWLAEQMQQHNLFVSFQVKTEIPTIPEDQALLLFQSSRELLFNCVKHAKTHEATITLEQVDGSLCIQISDQGAGFDLADASKKAHSPTSGFGLLSIRERMLSLGGRFELESSPGNGTTATLVLPLSDTLSSRSSPLTDRSWKRLISVSGSTAPKSLPCHPVLVHNMTAARMRFIYTPIQTWMPGSAHNPSIKQLSNLSNCEQTALCLLDTLPFIHPV